MPTERDETRRFNGAAVRTLGALERTLNRHAHELTAIDCEHAEAAEAVGKALENARAVKRRVNAGGGPSPTPPEQHC